MRRGLGRGVGGCWGCEDGWDGNGQIVGLDDFVWMKGMGRQDSEGKGSKLVGIMHCSHQWMGSQE